MVLAFALERLRVDLASIGNATFPAPGGWHPALPVAVLLAAVLPGTVEELVFRGVIFARLRESAPLWVAVVISSGLFGLAHLSPDMAPPNAVAVFLDTVLFGHWRPLRMCERGVCTRRSWLTCSATPDPRSPWSCRTR